MGKESGTRFVPGPDEVTKQVSDTGRLSDNFDKHFYRKQVSRGSAWDTSYAFRLAVATAKDRARLKLVVAVRLEARRLRDQANSTLSADYFSKADDFNSFVGQAHGTVTRSIDGVEGASDDAIKL